MQNKITIKIKKLVNYFNAGKFIIVIQEAEKLLKQLPKNIFLYNLIASSHQNLGNLEIAKKIFLEILFIDPKNIHALNNLGNLYKNINEIDNAESCYKKALTIDPNFINALVNYGSLNYELNNHKKAIELFKKALSFNNDNALAHYNIGLVYNALGEFKNSEFHLNQLIKINPALTLADKIISRFTKYNKDTPHLLSMKNRLKTIKFDKAQLVNIYFALGKAMEDMNDYKNSYLYINKANDTKRSLIDYNIKDEEMFFHSIKKNFTNFTFSESKNNEIIQDSPTPIFIVGMPRSGTSLVDQILSSHKEIHGIGELPYLQKLLNNNFVEQKLIQQTNFLKLEDQRFINKIKTEYYKFIEKFNIKRKYFTDKAPLNFIWIGFIKEIFPNAKIIHCRRNPKDNCLSIYKNNFDDNLNWAYNKEELSSFYQEYYELMKFWNKNLPNFIFNLNYEEIISNPEFTIKKLIKFCNLEWDENCLNFFENKRLIKTVSSAQARQPLYNSSVNSYNNYSEYLSDLFKSLEKFG